MAAETLTSTRAADSFPVFTGKGTGNLCCAYGSYAVAANVEDGDIFEMCKLPANAVVVGGWFYAGDLDTGTEAIDLDIGWAANGTEAADPDGLGNFGVLAGDAVAGIKPEVGTSMPLGGKLITAGPQSFSDETTIQVEANAAATTFAAGTISVVVYYVCA
mgnify:CR=1 FL=1